MALELIKYQTMMLFANHSPARCLEYDSLFCQAAACDPTLRWDTIKLYISLMVLCRLVPRSFTCISTSAGSQPEKLDPEMGPLQGESTVFYACLYKKAEERAIQR